MRTILLLYLCIILSNSVHAQQLSKKDEQFVDSVMNANYKTNEPGAVILIAKEGKPVFRKGYGEANLEFNVPNDPEYIFRIASMSKQFTAVCVLKLAQEGKLNLQDDIKKYLPHYNTHGRHITIENLLTHTNGINDFTSKKDFFKKAILNQSAEEIMNSFMDDSLSFEPGTDWGYSNSGYVVAGAIIEKVSGMPLSEFRRQYIFNPLNMSHTSIGTYDSLVVNGVYGYSPGGNGKYKPADYMSWSWPYAAGDILSSVDDLLKWDNALYTEKIIKKEWLQKAWKPFVLPSGESTNYCLGWTSNNYNGVQIIESAGGIYGFSSDAIRIPSKQLYIVILSNGAPVWPPNITSLIALHMIGPKEAKLLPNRLDKKALQGYTGVYAINHSGYARPRSSDEQLYQYITTSNDTLFAQSPGNQKGALFIVGKDLFVSAGTGTSHYQFHRDEKGQVMSVELYDVPIQTGPHRVQMKTQLPLPRPKKAITLNAIRLQLLKGKYDFGGGLILPVTVEGTKFYFQLPGQEKEEFFAENETSFFSKVTDVTIEFILDNKLVSGIKVKAQGEVHEGKKIE